MTTMIDNMAEFFAKKYLGNDTLRYADLATAIGLTADDKQLHPEIKKPYILTTEKTEYLSVIEITGAKSAFGEKDFSDYINNLATGLSHIYSHAGHKISLFFNYDKNQNIAEMNKVYRPHIAAMNRLNVDLSSILVDEAQKISAHYVYERCYLVLYTDIKLLDNEDKTADYTRINKELEGLKKTSRAENPIIYTLAGLKILHDAIFWQCVTALKGDADNGLVVNVLDVKEVGKVAKQLLMPTSTPSNWQPVSPFDKIKLYDRNTETMEDNIFPTKLKSQILSGSVTLHGDIVECDNLYYKSFYLDEMPMNKVTFQKLFRDIPKSLPYRIKFDLLGGYGSGTREQVLSVIRFIPALKQIANSLDYVVNANKTDRVVRFAISIVTWGKTEQEVKRHYSMLAKIIQGWGISTVSDTFANPVIPLISSIPALAQKTVGEIAYAPLSEALYMLPFERPASLWANDGIVFYLTEDGKLFPYRLASDKQAKHTEMITGTPGSGKSVLANRNNLSVLYLAQNNLPFMTIIDKGLSAKGIYDLLYHELPDSKKNQIAHIVLENNRDHVVNFLETQLGSRFLVDHEKVFVIQMLQAFCIDPQKGMPPNANDIHSVLADLIEITYEKLSHEKAKRYEPNISIINETLEKSGILNEKGDSWLDDASWYDVEDALFDKGEITAAALAHRHAMPELVDLQSYLSDARLTSSFDTVTIENSSETILSYISRSLKSAAISYPILSGITNYNYSAETRIVILDMMNVLGANTPEGQLQSGIMYLFARHLATKNYYLPQFSGSLINNIHPRYRDYHQKRINTLSEETKHTFYDECHNFKDIKFIQNALNTSDLEDRKFGIRTIFSSQYVQHMPDSVIKSVNTLFMMKLSDGDKEYLERLGMNIPDDVIKRFTRLSAGVANDGSGTHFLAIFKTNEGNICHILKNTVGTTQLWALTSNAKDRKLRELLYQGIGVKAALDVLTKNFPTSTAVRHINEMMNDYHVDDDQDVTVIEKLAGKLISEYQNKGSTR